MSAIVYLEGVVCLYCSFELFILFIKIGIGRIIYKKDVPS